MLIKTSDTNSIKRFIDKLYIPPKGSHKGQNGKVLVIGGSSLFHSASIWAAEVASHFVDMVHYSSTEENNEIVLSLKKKFRNGMVVHQKDIENYVNEDDAILLGPGMLRGEGEEATYTHDLSQRLIQQFPQKKFVFDAGALQMMDPQWLKLLKEKPILTPQAREFETLFGQSIHEMSVEQKVNIVVQKAKKYNCLILLKAVVDIISDGQDVIIIEGGNQGLTKGGTGDVLAGLAVSLFAKNNALVSAVLSSFLLKKTSDKLFKELGYWYNIRNIIDAIPRVLSALLKHQ